MKPLLSALVGLAILGIMPFAAEAQVSPLASSLNTCPPSVDYDSCSTTDTVPESTTLPASTATTLVSVSVQCNTAVASCVIQCTLSASLANSTSSTSDVTVHLYDSNSTVDYYIYSAIPAGGFAMFPLAGSWKEDSSSAVTIYAQATPSVKVHTVGGGPAGGLVCVASPAS